MDQLVQHGLAKWNGDNYGPKGGPDFNHQPLSHNLINNGFMQHKNGKKPAGFNTGRYRCGSCKLNLEAVHPFTKCFEGPYCNAKNRKCSNYPKSVSKCNDAVGPDRPYIFGTYNMGSRIWRGGLSQGWGSHGGGNILKITGSHTGNSGSTNYLWIRFPSERQAVTDKILFRGYIKMISGKARACMTISQCGPYWTPAITNKSPDGWHQINVVIKGSHITDLDYFYGPSLEVFGGASNNKGSFEMYLALPYMAIVMEKTSDMNNDGTRHKLRWQDSIMDQLVQHGIAKWSGDGLSKRRRLSDEETDALEDVKKELVTAKNEIATLKEQVALLMKSHQDRA